MKNLSTIFFLLLLNGLFGQSYKVIYKVKPNKNYKSITTNKKLKNKIQLMNKEIFEVAKDFEYVLIFNSNESIYSFKEPMKPEYVSDIIFYMACMSGGNREVYQIGRKILL